MRFDHWLPGHDRMAQAHAGVGEVTAADRQPMCVDKDVHLGLT